MPVGATMRCRSRTTSRALAYAPSSAGLSRANAGVHSAAKSSRRLARVFMRERLRSMPDRALASAGPLFDKLAVVVDTVSAIRPVNAIDNPDLRSSSGCPRRPDPDALTRPGLRAEQAFDGVVQPWVARHVDAELLAEHRDHRAGVGQARALRIHARAVHRELSAAQRPAPAVAGARGNQLAEEHRIRMRR